MNVIFGRDRAELLDSRYTVLELDTVCYGADRSTVELYCAVENLPIDELSSLEDSLERHRSLITAYRGRDWQTASLLINELRGCWSGELDSFYSDLSARIENLIETPPADDWDYRVTR